MVLSATRGLVLFRVIREGIGLTQRLSATGTLRLQASLTMSPSVKHFMSTQKHALGEERHFALLEKSAESNQGPAFNQFQVRNSVRLMHLFGPTFDHDC
jgi:hypothetical protein